MADHDSVAAQFARTASRYLFLVNAPDLAGRDRLDVLRELVPLLGELLALLIDLPDVSDDDAHREHGTPSHRVRLPIQSCLGEWDRYREVFDPNAPEHDEFGQGALVGASVSDDLADMAHDLGAGLAAFDAGNPRAAIWHWRFTGVSHWGQHAIDALRAITWRVMAAMRDPP
ncbi:MAG TPA: DUF5063 domain-containing protein [Kofleriaceae bacterium]|nr:DUF5063 domain-containing protein [Kofleriaceae bacterium]